MTPKRVGVLMSVAVLFLGACTTTAPPATPPTSAAPVALFQNYPATFNDFRFVWSAAPGIELTSGAAVAIRAYYESRLLAEGTYDAANVYPGYSRAVTFPRPEDTRGEPEQRNNPGPFIASSLHTANGDYAGQPYWGNTHLRILSITRPHGDAQAIVCYATFYEYERLAPDRWAILFDEPRFRLERLDLYEDPPPAPDTPPSPAAPQRGPLPAPLGDVFGHWHVRGLSLASGLRWYEPDGARVETPGVEDWKRQCDTEMPIPPDQRPGAFPKTRDTPPPYLPASPGWPGPVS